MMTNAFIISFFSVVSGAAVALITVAFLMKYHPARKRALPETEGPGTKPIPPDAVFNCLDMGLVIIDLNGCVRFMNTHALSLCGLEQDNTVGKRLTDIRPFADPPGCDHFKDLVRDIVDARHRPPVKKYISFEINGQPRLISETHYPVIDTCEIMIGLAMVLETMPGRICAAMTEAQADDRLRAFEASGAAMAIFEDDMSISMVNSEFERLTRFSKEEIEGEKTWPDFIADDDLDPIKKYLSERQQPPDQPPPPQEFRLIDKTGQIKHILYRVNIIAHTKRCVATLINITERKQAEERLKHSEACYRTLVESTMDGFFMFELPSGQFLKLNQMLCDLYGYTMEEALKLTIWDLISPEDHVPIHRDIERWVNDEAHIDNHEVINTIRKNGSRLRVEVSTSLVKFEEKIVFQGLIKDVTEREQLQRQLQESQKMNAIGTLAGGLAHDFNNLLMGVQGYTTLMLLDISPSHPHYKRLKFIEQHVEKGANLTRQILDFAQTKQQELEKADLNVLIKRSLNMFSQTRKEVNIHTTYQHSIWKTKVDTGQIEQVLLNLYLNAWQAMATGGDLYVQTQNISFSAHQIRPLGLEPGNYVKISVKDTGTGIRKELHSKIFDPFFTTKPTGKGTGLGLASSYGIIRNHGGLIEVQSDVGKGALFNIYLPAVKSKTEPKSLPDGHHPEKTRTIMLVDDERLITDVGSELLTKLGYQVMTASSGKEAVTLYREHRCRIDLVILDIIMPVMGGRETYARLKSINPEVKVLLASGYSRDHIVEGLMKDGCNGFIQKPFKLEYLDEQIRHILCP